MVQFSDHELVRRAATEAMCNLFPHPKMIEHLKLPDSLKLWAAFAQLGMEDPPTAAAALGCLAMAVRDPEVSTWRGIPHVPHWTDVFQWSPLLWQRLVFWRTSLDKDVLR